MTLFNSGVVFLFFIDILVEQTVPSDLFMCVFVGFHSDLYLLVERFVPIYLCLLCPRWGLGLSGQFESVGHAWN